MLVEGRWSRPGEAARGPAAPNAASASALLLFSSFMLERPRPRGTGSVRPRGGRECREKGLALAVAQRLLRKGTRVADVFLRGFRGILPCLFGGSIVVAGIKAARLNLGLGMKLLVSVNNCRNCFWVATCI